MLYHISKYKILMPMKPRIPKSKYEDQTTPRICFSTSIQGCLIGVNENKDISGEVFHVYGLETSDYITPTKEQVKDVDITGEVWVTEKCSPKHLYDIKVIGRKSEKTEKINGKVFKVPVWDYEKIEDLEESEILDEGLIKRAGQHIKLKKKYGTFKYGDAADKLLYKYRSAGFDNKSAHRRVRQDLRDFDEINHPIISKYKVLNTDVKGARTLDSGVKKDPFERGYKTDFIRTSDGKTIEVGHGASKHDPVVHGKSPTGKNADLVIACNASGNRAPRCKNLGKGSYGTKASSIKVSGKELRNPDGTVPIIAGSGSDKAYLKKAEKTVKKVIKRGGSFVDIEEPSSKKRVEPRND